jgi:hypothetical protein
VRPGCRTPQAGREFLKALASDLATVASRLSLLLTANRWRTRPSPPSAPSRISQGPGIGRVLWRLSIALLGFGSICAGALAVVILWVLFGFPPEPQRSDADPLRSQFDVRKGEPVGSVGPLKVTGTSRQDLGREPGAQGRPEAKVTSPSIAFPGTSPPAQSAGSGGPNAERSSRASNCTDQPTDGLRRLCEAGSSSPDTAEPKKATKERQTETGAGADQPQLVRTEPQDRRPAARQEEISTTLTDLRPRAQCNVALCAAKYGSFRAADCTYQPHGGGPRTLCEPSTRSEEAAPQVPRAAIDPRSEAKHTQISESPDEVPKSATPARGGAQCNVALCATTYSSFHAADCTYQPHGGGPRRICER